MAAFRRRRVKKTIENHWLKLCLDGYTCAPVHCRLHKEPCATAQRAVSWASDTLGRERSPRSASAHNVTLSPPIAHTPNTQSIWVPFHMHKKFLLTISSALIMASAAHLAHAQSTPAAAPAPSAAKKELIAKLLKLQQPGIEAMSTDMAQEPALQMLDRAAAVLQARVAPEKRDATIKGVQADAKKYMEKTVPMVNSRAVALAPDTVGPVLNLRFTEDELKKVIAILESPEYAKFQQMSGEMQQALQAKLVADTRTGVEANLKTLEADLTARLSAAAGQPAESVAPAAPEASKAAKPAAKK